MTISIDPEVDRPASFSWFPGHMLKAQRELRAKLSLIDIVIEIVDARAPYSSRNPELEQITESKMRIIALSKTDLSDNNETRRWLHHFDDRQIPCIALDKNDRNRINKFKSRLSNLAKQCTREHEQKRRSFRSARAMIVGAPNVGKSTLINLIVGQRKATTGPLPGVTRMQQWVKLNDHLELLDTPGLMVPKIVNMETGLKLALLGIVKDRLVDPEIMAEYFLEQLRLQDNLDNLHHYGDDIDTESIATLLTGLAQKQGFLSGGGQADTRQSAVRLINDFRSGKLGVISLEQPPGLAARSGNEP